MSCLWIALLVGMAVGAESPTVGREGAISVVLTQPDLQPVPVVDRAPLVVRIASRTAVADGTRYELRWLGAEPGDYDLAHFLVDVEGRPARTVSPIPVTVHSLLPAGFPGDVQDIPHPTVPHLGGYHRMMIGVGIAWLLLIPLLWRRRRRIPAPITIAVPTLSEQLRALIEQARSAGLDPDHRARLERLLLAHWRTHLALHDLDMPTALLRLREHPTAGAVLRQLDAWLHAPPGRSTVDVDALLAPYSAAS